MGIGQDKNFNDVKRYITTKFTLPMLPYYNYFKIIFPWIAKLRKSWS